MILTSKGTPIQRYFPTGVGKLMGHHLYLHASYAEEAVQAIRRKNPDVGLRLLLALDYKSKKFPDFQFQCVRFCLNDGLVRFDEAPDFDTAREPHVGRWLLLCHDGYSRQGCSQAIWHHKFLWIKVGYKGFDVEESEEWSRTYLARLKEPPKGTDKAWLEQLTGVGLHPLNAPA